MAPDSSAAYYRKGFGLKAEVEGTLSADYTGRLVDLLKARDYALSAGGVTVRLAREFGFCYGVERAVEYAYQTRRKFPDRRIVLVGEIIHNPHVNAKLREMGIEILEARNVPLDHHRAVAHILRVQALMRLGLIGGDPSPALVVDQPAAAAIRRKAAHIEVVVGAQDAITKGRALTALADEDLLVATQKCACQMFRCATPLLGKRHDRAGLHPFDAQHIVEFDLLDDPIGCHPIHHIAACLQPPHFVKPGEFACV